MLGYYDGVGSLLIYCLLRRMATFLMASKLYFPSNQSPEEIETVTITL